MASRKPASSRGSIHFGKRLSPMTNLGKRNFSTIFTLKPFLLTMDAATVPEGPAPITNTSTFSLFIDCIFYKKADFLILFKQDAHKMVVKMIRQKVSILGMDCSLGSSKHNP